MDVKLGETSTSGEASDASASVKKKSVFVFIQEMKEELKKVSWTSKAELIFSTKMVILSTFVLGFGIYLVDLAIKGVLEVIKSAIHLIFG